VAASIFIASSRCVELRILMLFGDPLNIADSLGGDDADDDGLPDEWETNCFGNLNANPADPAANSDYTVWQCYIAGLDPTSLTNRFLFFVLRSLFSGETRPLDAFAWFVGPRIW